MEHFYNNGKIDGFFGYESLYLRMIDRANSSDNCHFVEVGVWEGMSACFMAVEIANSDKNIKFDCVDMWDFVETSEEFTKDEFSGLFEKFVNNITPVKDYINIVRSLSWEAADRYQDNSLDFVFIDAAHDYTSVTKDLIAWYPKIKNNGVIAGHDYAPNVGVYAAVNNFFADKGTVEQDGVCLLYYKN